MKAGKFSLLGFVLLVSVQASAYSWISKDLAGTPFDLPAGNVRSISLGGHYQIRNIVVQVEGRSRSFSEMDVMVNGEVKGTLAVPGVDPSYVVTIGEGASSIEFVSRNGAIRIQKVIATVSDTATVPRTAPGSLGTLLPQNEITQLARTIITNIDRVSAWVTVDNQEKYLAPIKSAAGRLYAIASSRGTYATKTLKAVETLLLQFDSAQPFFDSHMTCNECFDGLVQLLASRERLAASSQ